VQRGKTVIEDTGEVQLHHRCTVVPLNKRRKQIKKTCHKHRENYNNIVRRK